MQAFLFYFFSTGAVLSALAVITTPKPTRALLSLIATMFCLAILFGLLGATFIAMVHLIVYAGAVLVLFLFVIMLQGIGAKEIPLFERFKYGARLFQPHLFLSSVVVLAFAAKLIAVFSRQDFPPLQIIEGTVESIGGPLFRDYLLPFELISILLMLGVFAAVALAKKEDA